MTYEPAVPFDDPRHLVAHHFLVEEAAILDAQEWDRWLELLHPEIRYVMPVRVTTAVDAGWDERADMAHFDEDHYSLSKRVERLRTEHAWTEDPPSRTRHLVTNVRTMPAPDGTTDPDADIEVCSYVLLFRSRGDTRPPEFVSAARRDVLSRYEGGWRLRRRQLSVDEAVLRTQNLAIFL